MADTAWLSLIHQSVISQGFSKVAHFHRKDVSVHVQCHLNMWPLTSKDKKGKGKGSCLESRLHDNTCSTDFTFPLARWAPMQPATIDLTLDLCTRYPLRLGEPRQCGIQSLPDTSTHGQHWESNAKPSDLESNALSTGSLSLCVRFDDDVWFFPFGPHKFLHILTNLVTHSHSHTHTHTHRSVSG